MYRISKTFTFSAQHRLHLLPETHKCNRSHGHNYAVTVILESETLDKFGMVVDYGELDAFKHYLDSTFDHRQLGDVLPDIHSTAENLAAHFFHWCKERWPQVAEVQVSETDKTLACYRENGIKEAQTKKLVQVLLNEHG